MKNVPSLSYLIISMGLISCPVMAEQNEIQETMSEQSDKEENDVKDVLVIQASIDDISKPEVITSEKIRTGTIGNGNVTDLLKTLPAVQMSNGGMSGNQQGEIKPNKITIRGANSYQNNFMLDGISFNNDFDPSSDGNGVTSTTIESSEQGFYIDSRLIDNIKVYDNNIPVEYGNFTGGVVDITSKRWRYNNGGSIFFSSTRSAWNKVYYDHRVDFNTANNDSSRPSRFQPHYKKESFGGWFEAGITDTLGIVFSASHRESDISAVKFMGLSPSLDKNNDIVITNKPYQGFKNQTRDSNNFSGKLSWYMTENTNADLSINYSKHEDYSFSPKEDNSGTQTDHSGIGGMFELTTNFDFAELSLNAGYQQLQDKRKSDQNFFIGFNDYSQYPNKTYNSGGVGDLKTTQKNTNFKTKLQFRPIQFGATLHEPKVGFEYSKTKGIYERDKDYYRYNFYYFNMQPYMNDYWSTSVFEAGHHSASYTNYAAYLDDTIKYQRLTIRPGIRLDYDDFVKEANFAPRITTSYDLLGNGQTNIIAGYSRYYGRNMLIYALYGAQNAGLRHCSGFMDVEECAPGTQIDDSWEHQTDFEGLNSLSTPYSDEFSFGLEQTLFNTLWKFQYVHRDGHNEVVSRPKANNSVIKIFDNSGKSSHDSFSISVSNPEPWLLGNTENTIISSIIWEKNKSNKPKNGYASYDPSGRINKDYVYYNGKVIKASKLPATDFNLPLRFNFELRTQIPDWDLSVYNIFEWHGRRYQAARYDNEYHNDSQHGQLARYTREDFASTFRWDMKVSWAPSFAYGGSVSLEVDNVLNKKNITDRYSYYNSTRDMVILNSYDVGRQFWLQLNYDF